MSSIKDQIRQEIERLYDGEAPKHDQQCEFEDGYFTGIATISKFIDSLPDEKTKSEDLEEELVLWRHNHFDGERDGHYSGEYLERASQLDLARHFAEWGAKHLK